MRTLAILLFTLALTPFGALAQDVPTAVPLDGAPPTVEAPVEPTPVVAPEPAPSGPERELSLYVGVGVGSSLNFGAAGTFGYQLEASVGLSYWLFSAELLGGTTAINSDRLDSVGPHLGGALRVMLFEVDRVGLQLGVGVRHHFARAQDGTDYSFSGGLMSLRLLLPLNDNIAVRIDAELEHAFDGPLRGAEQNRGMFGFAVETRIQP
jgi:hypothetical protein